MVFFLHPLGGGAVLCHVLVGAVLCIAAGAGIGCGGSKPALTEAQMEKLAPALQRVVNDEAPAGMPLRTETRADGATVYPVMLRITNVDAVRQAGIPLNSVQGRVATARLSASELRRAARLDAVTQIAPSGQSFPTQ